MKKSFRCECGAYHEFSIWLYAHWGEVTVHTCEECGREHEIVRGSAILSKGPRGQKKGRKRCSGTSAS